MIDNDLHKALQEAPYSDALLDPNVSLEVMTSVMGYYIKLNKVVKAKLSYAGEAANKRAAEFDELTSSSDIESKHVQNSKKVKSLIRHLKKLEEILNISQLSTEEIEQVNLTLEELPGKVKVYYEHLVHLDKELIRLVDEITSEDYQRAYKRAKKITDTIQKRKNLLSGLRPQEEFSTDRKKSPVKSIKKIIKAMPAEDMGYTILPDGRKVKIL